MGKPTGFIEFEREAPFRRPVDERLSDYSEVDVIVDAEALKRQGARCMDCGIPFCQSGCPLGNIIPDWNDLVYRDRWREAYERLAATNNFPEFTGRICPAPCESACVLGITEDPVTIEQIERAVVERAFEEGWIEPIPPVERSGKTVAVVGSGPAGLACADQLNRAGHTVTVFERHDRPGGLLRYGIPDFKLEKGVLDRRLDLMAADGVLFVTGVEVGRDIPSDELATFDASVLCGGATLPRDLPIEGRSLAGIHFAWDYLQQQNRRVAGDSVGPPSAEPILADGKHVVVIGGGDTGSDCVGTANRQGAISVTQFELLPVPPDVRPAHQPWPYMPTLLSVTSSHEEGADRHWSVMTRRFGGQDGRVDSLETVEAAQDSTGRFVAVEGTERTWPADLVLLAIGYVGPEREGLLADLGVELDGRGNVAAESGYMTSVPGVFAAGDLRRGQSLVVWAISEGREAARAVDEYLMERAALPTKGAGDLPRVR
jgi:glutamate synthase (NADPH/NADH) small chain